MNIQTKLNTTHQFFPKQIQKVKKKKKSRIKKKKKKLQHTVTSTSHCKIHYNRKTLNFHHRHYNKISNISVIFKENFFSSCV